LVQAHTAPELLIDMATTAVTFLAVGSSALSGLRSFGFLLAFGLVASVLVTLTVLPILLRFVGDRRDPERSWLAALADRWAGHRQARPVAFATIALMGVGAVFLAVHGVPLRASTDALRPDDDPVGLARTRIEAELGFSTVPVAMLWPQAEEPSPLWGGLHRLQEQGVLRFWSGIEAIDTVSARTRVATFRRTTNGFVDATLADFTAAGLSAEPFRQALDELAVRIAADPPTLAPNIVELDGVPYRIVSAWPRERLEHDNYPTFAAAVASQLGPRVQVHGGPTVLRELEDVLRADLQRALLLATLLAMVMVGVWQRSVRHGLLALLPSSIGMCVTLVALVVCNVPLSLISFVAIPFVLGIGVDEGVHLSGHFRSGAAVTGAVGVGVARTSLSTVLGFSSLWLATSPGLVELGCIVAFGSFCSMLAGLFVLTPLLAARTAQPHQSRAQQNQ
ncbi:MAG: MMPL family transporter, partial [Planctomycetota bacterium]